MLHILELFIHSLHNTLNLSKLYNRVGSAYFTDVHISVTDDFKSEKESFFIIIIQIYLLECKLQATTSIHSNPEVRKQKYFITKNDTNLKKTFNQTMDLNNVYTLHFCVMRVKCRLGLNASAKSIQIGANHYLLGHISICTNELLLFLGPFM